MAIVTAACLLQHALIVIQFSGAFTVAKKNKINQTAQMSRVLGVVNKVAIVVFLIIIVALGAGLLLDRLLGTGGIFTLLLVLASVPVTLTAIYRISLAAIAELEEEMQPAADEEMEDDATE